MNARRCAAYLAVALVLFGAPGAGAQGRSDEEKAREHFERGKSLHEQGRYREAIEELERAHELSGLPALLFNIAQAHRLEGDYAAAVSYYELFLERAPDHPLAKEAEEKLEASREALREIREEGTDPDRPPVEGAAAGPTGREPEPEAPRLEARRGGSEGGARLRTAGAYVAVAGALGLALGGYFGWRARSISDELSSHEGPWTDELLAKQETGRAAERNMLIAGGAGLLALTTGATFYLIGRNREKGAPAVALSPARLGSGIVVTLGRGWR